MLDLSGVSLEVKLKYLVEWLFCFWALILLSPLMILISLAIKLTSKGPVFYKAERLGYKERIFKLVKFRSMKHNCPKIITNAKTVVARGDPRLTSIGSFLRIGFDELPQLLNVLKGELTLIGPRPSEPTIRKYLNDVLSLKHNVMPGITGLAVICNGRALSVNDNFSLDIWYSENHSFWLDFKIAIMTPLYMIGFKNIARGLRDRVLADWKNRYPDQPFDFKE